MQDASVFPRRLLQCPGGGFEEEDYEDDNEEEEENEEDKEEQSMKRVKMRRSRMMMMRMIGKEGRLCSVTRPFGDERIRQLVGQSSFIMRIFVIMTLLEKYCSAAYSFLNSVVYFVIVLDQRLFSLVTRKLNFFSKF